MRENDVMDIEQRDELDKDGNEVGESVDSTADTEIVLPADALEEIFEQSGGIPVRIVEEVEEEEELQVFALNGAYQGTISDTYLDYFEGIVQKLPFDTHYVIWRSGEYAYTLAYGESIELSDGVFIGDCDVVNIYRNTSNYNNTWYVGYESDSLRLDSADLFIYSDLGMYPTVERGFGSLEANAILFAIGFSIVFSIVTKLFGAVVKRFTC